MEKKITKIGVLLIISLAFIVSMSYAKNADISIENAMISGGYFSWEIHITPTDDWGVGNRKALGDCSWYFDANMNALSGIELTYVAPQVDPSEGYTNTCAITGGHPQVTTDLDYDNYDGVNLTQGVNYHLYTVRMTITDPSAQSDLYWDELNTGIFNAPDQEVIENYIGNGDITLPVELSAFTATYNFENGCTSINWTTASETDVIGFNLYRSNCDDYVTGIKINSDIIDGHGTTTEINHYEFIDIDHLSYGTTYYYWLQSVELDGISNVYSSISLTPEEGSGGFIDDFEDNILTNYPNPFKGSTTIEYGIKCRLKAELVEIRIYNVAGQLVDTIEARYGTAVWNVDNLPTGVYFYQLKTESYNEVKKMMLIK